MAKLLDLSVYGPGHISNILQVDSSVYAKSFITDGGNNTQVVRGDGTLQAISSLSVNYSNSAGRLNLTSCYNGTTNNDLWSTIKTSKSSYLGTATIYEVYNDGGPSTYGEVLDIVSMHFNHWQPQLWFDAGKGGRLRYRNKEYNDNSWGDWRTVAWTTDIPTIPSSLPANGGNADTVDNQHFSYTNTSNSPTYLWATNSNGTSFLAARTGLSVNYANSAGSVAWNNVSSKPATATRWPSWSEVTNKPSSFTPSSHTHSYLPLSGGTLSGGITFKYGSNNTDMFIQFSSTDSSDPQTVYLGIRRPVSSYGPCYKDNNGNFYDLIHSGNYTKYTVKTDGTGASGTWGIDITGSAGSVAWGNITGKPGSFTPATHTHYATKFKDSRNEAMTPAQGVSVDGIAIDFKTKANGVGAGSGDFCGLVTFDPYSDVTGGYPIQMGFNTGADTNNKNEVYIRTAKNSSTWNTWRTIINDVNYTSYTVKKDGTGASGTWCIDITGSAGSVAWNNVSSKPATATRWPSWSEVTNKPINFKAYAGSLASGGWKTMQGKDSSPSIAISYNTAAAAWNSGTYSSSLVYGCADTRGLLDCAYNKPIVTFGGCSYNNSDDDNPTWYMKLSGTNGTTYNLDSMPYASSAGNADTVDGIHGQYIFRQIRYFDGASSDNTWIKIQKKGQYSTGTCLISVYQYGHVGSFIFSINNTYPARSTLALMSKDLSNSDFRLSYSPSEGYFYFKIARDYSVYVFGSETENEMLGTGELVTSTPEDLAECNNISINVADTARSVDWSGITNKPSSFTPSSHTHTKSQITDFPSSLPANGGNADTVDNKHASDFMPVSGSYITGTTVADVKANLLNYFRKKPATTTAYTESSFVTHFGNNSYTIQHSSVCGWMTLNPGYDNYTYGHFLVSEYGKFRLRHVGLDSNNTWYGPYTIAYTSDIPTKVSQLTNDAGYKTTDTTYSTATSSTLGLVKIGYAANGKNYPVQLSNGQMYVNVPWTDTNTDTNTWRPITDSYSGTSSETSLSQKGGNAIYNALLNGYATSAGNADTCDSLHVHSGRNNEANKIVRTDGNGYIQCGYINSSSGDEGNNSSPVRVWGTNGSDSYMRTYLTSALSVKYATTATTATTLYTNNTSQDASLCYNESPGLHFYRFNGTGNDIGGGDGFILQWSWNPGSVGGQIYLDDNPSKVAAIRGYDSNSKTFTSWSKFIHSDNYKDYVNTTNFPGLNKTGTVTSVTVTGANGLSGTGTITSSGTITLSNAGVRSTTINGNYLRVNTNGTNADLTIPYATNADTVDGQNFSYSNSSNSPTYLWATNSNGSSFLAARTSLSVNYASSAGDADTLDNFHANTFYENGYVMFGRTIDASGLDPNTWYPVIIPIGSSDTVRIEVRVCLDSGTNPSWSTHSGGKGFSVRKIWEVNGSGWGANSVNRRILVSEYSFANTDPVRGVDQLTYSSIEYVYVRGGGKYYFFVSHNVACTLYTTTYTASGQSVGPTTTTPSDINITYISTTGGLSNGTISSCNSGASDSGNAAFEVREYLRAGANTSIASHSIMYAPRIGFKWTGRYSANLVYFDSGFRFVSSNGGSYVNLQAGTIYGSAFYESSDERLKDFYNTIDADLDKLSSLPKKFFKWKSNPNGKFEIGTSAQELQKIYPQLVNTDDNGYLTVAYDKLSIVALKAIDKLYEMNKNLEKRIQILESKR